MENKCIGYKTDNCVKINVRTGLKAEIMCVECAENVSDPTWYEGEPNYAYLFSSDRKKGVKLLCDICGKPLRARSI